jgi:hypothetical protein
MARELKMLEELERLEAEERAVSPVKTKVVNRDPVYAGGAGLVSPGGREVVPTNPLQTFREGIGSGLTRMGRGGTNVLIKALNRLSPSLGVSNNIPTPGFASDEALREQDRLDAPLTGSAEGGMGQFVGQAAASLPLGGVPRASGAALEAMPAVARTLAGPTVRSGIEGSISGAATAPPEDQAGSAALGFGLGAGLTKAGQALKRTVGGLAQPGEAAGHLEQFGEQHGKDIFIPAAQAIPDTADLPSRLVKTLYKEVLPLVPGASGRIKSQGKKLAEDVREIALKEADYKGVLTPDDIADPAAAVKKLRKTIDDEINDTVKQYSFRVPPRSDIMAKIQAGVSDVDDVTANKIATLVDESIARFSSNKPTLVGENLLRARQQILDKTRKLAGVERQAADEAVKVFDDVIEARLKLSNSPVMKKDLERYMATRGPSVDLEALEKATQKAEVKRGAFTPAQLVKSAGQSGTQKHLGQTAEEVLSENLGSPSPAGRMAAYSVLGGLGYFGSPGALAGVIGGGNALATELGQDVLLGRTRAQQALIEALRNNPKKMQYLGAAGRGGATAEAGE